MDILKKTKQKRLIAAASLLIICLLPSGGVKARAADTAEVMLQVEQFFSESGAQAAPGSTFSYLLSPLNNVNNPLPIGSGVAGYAFSVTGTAYRDIGPLSFTQEGFYTYEMKHTTAEQAGYTYDMEVYKLEIMVESDLTFTIVAWKKNNEKAGALEFWHSYNYQQGLLPSDPADMIDPPLVKTVSGLPPSDSVFTFRLSAQNQQNPMPAGSVNGVKIVKIAGAGQSSFGTWSYTEEGVYYYTVREENSGVAGYTYDNTVYTITDTVTAQNNKLVVERVVTNNSNRRVSSLSYINSYKSGGGGGGGGGGEVPEKEKPPGITDPEKPPGTTGPTPPPEEPPPTQELLPEETLPPQEIKPPAVSRPGNNLQEDGEDYLELGEDGVPIGRWHYDEEEQIWIFEEFPPEGGWPQTGDESRAMLYAILFGLAALTALGSTGYLLSSGKKIR
ncbi:MAG: hypothetical protein FWG61_04595 [Firmicutes bacterium]|nr:hypothetical protein [Bacillota bacterium]